jgi:prepilin-type N-terminal cleavage/methylation domain-containing protein
MRHGTTLLEVLLALALAGLLAVMAVPAIGTLRDRLAVERAVETILTAHARARITAVAEGRVALLTLTADSMLVQVIESAADTVTHWRSPGTLADGVTATGLPRRITFGPSGVPMGVANGTYTISRGGVQRQILVSRYGRIRIP